MLSSAERKQWRLRQDLVAKRLKNRLANVAMCWSSLEASMEFDLPPYYRVAHWGRELAHCAKEVRGD